jgi:hypothetical protein
VTTPTLDIVVVSFNAREDLARCLTSLRDSPPGLGRRVIVVDNASTDGSPQVVAREFPDTHLITLPENIGFARANNVGIRAGRGDLVLLLNSDTVVPPGALDRLADVLQARPTAAAAGPRLVDAHGRAELSFGRMISPWNELRQKTLQRLSAHGPGPLRDVVERLTSRARLVDWVSGACLLVWRADALAVGLLDERYFMYAEDVDFCAALRARGREILFTPQAQVVHLRGRSRRGHEAATEAQYRRSQLAFYAKHHPAWHRLLAWYLRAKGAWPPPPA